MSPTLLRIMQLRALLRSPRLIVAETVAFAIAGVLGASVPQTGASAASGWLVSLFGLNHVFSTPGFLLITVVATVSLVLVVSDQLRHLKLLWFGRLTMTDFSATAFRAEFLRESRLDRAPESIRIWSKHKLGLVGSPLFHLGLLLLILAGGWHALFATQAVVDLLEGESLEPKAEAWGAQWPGLLARPMALSVPVTLTTIQPTRYAKGDLCELKTRLVWPTPGGDQQSEIRINQDLHLKGGRLFLTPEFGTAAVIEWQKPGAAEPKRHATLLTDSGGASFEGSAPGPLGEQAFFRTEVGTEGNHPTKVEVRVMHKSALVFAGEMEPGESVALPNGDRLVLNGLPFWARLRGSRDPSLWLAYPGLVFAMAGAFLIFGCTKVDYCLLVVPAGNLERVLLAMKPQRLAPLFREEFQRLVREQGGPELSFAESRVPEPKAKTAPKSRLACGGDCGLCARHALAGPCPASRLHAGAAACLVLIVGLLSTGCGQSRLEQARARVEKYNQAVSEAYRRGDIKLIDPVVGPNEGKKLTGLLGVRTDLGLTLDSHLLSLEVTSIEQHPDVWRVRTKERWRYRDLRIGSGEQVGEESLDSYEMLYVFKKLDKAWVVDEIQFTSPPQVGRKKAAWPTHSTPTRELAGTDEKEPNHE